MRTHTEQVEMRVDDALSYLVRVNLRVLQLEALDYLPGPVPQEPVDVS